MQSPDSLISVLRYMRSAAVRAMRGRELLGREIPADAASGRNAPCWVHEAPGGGERPVVFEMHGGGFALGDARKEDALRAWVSRCFDVHVVGVEYRLAPEHPAPAALEDALATISFVASGAAGIAVRPDGLYALGYSAGANLALACAFAMQKRDDIAFAGLALHYPFLDAATPPVAAEARDIDLPFELMNAFNVWYVGKGDARDPLISPLFATDAQLVALPPVAMRPVVGDELFVQADALRARLEGVGAKPMWHPVEGMYHGYIEDAADVESYEAATMPETIAARPAGYVDAAGEQLRGSLEDLLGPAPRPEPFPGSTAAARDASRAAGKGPEGKDASR